MTEEQKMLAGKLYDPSDSRLEKRRQLAHRLSKEYNDTLETDADRTVPLSLTCPPISRRSVI